MHTILPNPPSGMRDVVRDIYALSDRVITSANAGIELLNNTYGLNKKKLTLIPHGVPAVPLVDTVAKTTFRLVRKVCYRKLWFNESRQRD